MSSKQRFIKSIVASSEAQTPAMPWVRGARRAAFIVKRNNTVLEKKAA